MDVKHDIEPCFSIGLGLFFLLPELQCCFRTAKVLFTALCALLSGSFFPVFVCFLLHRLFCCFRTAKVLFTALCALLSGSFFPVFVCFLLHRLFLRDLNCSDNFGQTVQNNKKISKNTETPPMTQSRGLQIFIETCSVQEYVHFFGGCKSFANRTGWVHKQEICNTGAVNRNPVLYLFSVLEIARWCQIKMYCLWRKGRSLGLDGIPRLLN